MESSASDSSGQETKLCKMQHFEVYQPDGRLQSVQLDSRAKGQDCLEQVCRRLGIFEEADYFGLTFDGARGEQLWVNTRNRLSTQVQPGCCLRLSVKFFVQPHMLVLDETRHLFFLEAKRRLADWLPAGGQSAEELVDDVAEELGEEEEEPAAALVALLAQEELGDCPEPDAECPDYGRFLPGADVRLASAASSKHRQLAGVSDSAARRRFLELAARLRMYGCHYHAAKDCFEARIRVAVGPCAICLCRSDGTVLERFPYARVQKVTISSRVLYFSLSRDDGSVKEFGYRLVSRPAANALYRCVTETHSFFRCDTVRSGVSGQTCRDVKNALVSFFVETESSLIPNFVFDVCRTAKEVHDASRRRLHKCNAAAAASAACGREASRCHRVSGAELEQLKEQMQQAQQLQQCRICMDNRIEVVLVPCGHVVACGECAERLSGCPMCREPIAARHRCQLPC